MQIRAIKFYYYSDKLNQLYIHRNALRFVSVWPGLFACFQVKLHTTVPQWNNSLMCQILIVCTTFLMVGRKVRCIRISPFFAPCCCKTFPQCIYVNKSPQRNDHETCIIHMVIGIP